MKEWHFDLPSAAKWGLLGVALLSSPGCSDGKNPASSKTVYQSPEEVDKKKADLYDAMKGGAYGSAGRKSAPQVDPSAK